MQWPFYQREAQWPFYQCRSNRMARPPDFSDKFHFRYYPARSIYQRPGQAILSKSRPNGRFINARPNGRFINAEATGWPDLQISATNCIFAIIPHGQFISGRAKLFSTSRPSGRFINTRPNGRFINAEATGWPDLQISTTNSIFAIILHDQFISGRAKLFSAKAGPMAVLSTRGPMTVESRQKQPDGQTSRFQRQIALSPLSRTISLLAAGPSYSQQKQTQLPFYQRKTQWPFYQCRSNRIARPPDFSDKFHFRYYPARLVYQRPGQAILSKSRPNGRFINARPNGRFINAEATGWPDLQISATNCIFAIIPHGQFISGRAKLFSTSRPSGRFINTRPNGRFINAEATGWPDLQISTTNSIFAIIPHDQFISGRAKLFSAKASPIAVLSTQNPMAVLSMQKQPDSQTSRFQRQIPFSLLSRTVNLSAAGPSYSQQKQAQWPLYQREAQWPFYQCRSNRMAIPPDFSDKLHFRIYPARSVY